MEDLIDLNDVASADFPAVSPNVIKQSFNGGINALEGFNPEIHETPPRRTKSGAWALKRGNKKGFIVGKTKIEQQAAAAQETAKDMEIKNTEGEPPPSISGQTKNPPPLNIPPNPEEVEAQEKAEAEQVQAAADMNAYSAQIVAGTITSLGAALSGYQADDDFKREYAKAFELWFAEMGGVQVKAWVQVALLSGIYGMNVVKSRKKESALERFKNWLVVKFYNFKNRKKRAYETSGGGGETSSAAASV